MACSVVTWPRGRTFEPRGQICEQNLFVQSHRSLRRQKFFAYLLVHPIFYGQSFQCQNLFLQRIGLCCREFCWSTPFWCVKKLHGQVVIGVGWGLTVSGFDSCHLVSIYNLSLVSITALSTPMVVIVAKLSFLGEDEWCEGNLYLVSITTFSILLKDRIEPKPMDNKSLEVLRQGVALIHLGSCCKKSLL